MCDHCCWNYVFLFVCDTTATRTLLKEDENGCVLKEHHSDNDDKHNREKLVNLIFLKKMIGQ